MGLKRLLGLAGALLLCASASAQTQLRLDSAEIGIGGIVRSGGWNRFELYVSAFGAPFEGIARIDLDLLDGASTGGLSVSTRLSIPAGGTVRWEGAAVVSASADAGALTLTPDSGLDGGDEQVFELEFQPSADEGDIVLLSASSRRGMFWEAFGEGAPGVKMFETGAPDRFPAEWAGWKSVDALVWFAGGVPLERLRSEQRLALERWVRQGGRLAVVTDDSTRGALPMFWDRLLPPEPGWISVGLGRVGRYAGSGPHRLDGARLSRRLDNGPEYLNRLSARLRASSKPASLRRWHRFWRGAAVWLVIGAVLWLLAIRFRSRLLLCALAAFGIAAGLAPSALRLGSPLRVPLASGAARVFPDAQEALWFGAVEAPPAEERGARVALPPEMRIAPIAADSFGEWRRIPGGAEIRGYSPHPNRSTFWLGEAFTPFVGQIAGGAQEDGRFWAANRTPFHFERAALIAGSRAKHWGEMPPGGQAEGRLQPMRSLRAFWRDMNIPSRALSFWAREGRLDRLFSNDLSNGQQAGRADSEGGAVYFVGWARGATPFAQRGSEIDILLVVAPLGDAKRAEIE